ncbi:polysaccharide deacetylase family protein [Paramagnetospirillum kuznetsovii]|uniref:polysaccharide deacetylase family protein n=1 Tax=Paramagnetospirillum kuznetsovii TaxID=2053833 RepID=UPI00137516C6|nr:polysaccharide deacetylase family protein [Paramagnetospirillum kuznetsovii]
MVALVLAVPVQADVVTGLPGPGRDKVVALTFDGCEGRGAPALLDQSIVTVLEAERVPATLFVTGLFARRNAEGLKRLAASQGVEVENHSFDHPQHMERLDGPAIRKQIEDADRLIEEVTGRKPRFFRFPAGNYDPASLAAVEGTGKTVVHWSFASGDPVRGLTPAHLRDYVLSKIRPGAILIFHINGRAPATAEALPGILAELRKRGYRFARLDEVVP